MRTEAQRASNAAGSCATGRRAGDAAALAAERARLQDEVVVGVGGPVDLMARAARAADGLHRGARRGRVDRVRLDQLRELIELGQRVLVELERVVALVL